MTREEFGREFGGLFDPYPCWLCGSKVKPCADERCVKAWRYKPVTTVDEIGAAAKERMSAA